MSDARPLGLFSAADLDEIRVATSAAESATSGEIVPYIVGRVDDHAEARWLSATLGALGAALAAGAVHGLSGAWGGFGVLWITLPAVAGASVGFVLSALPAVGRLLVPDETLDHRVRLRAEAAFLEEEVFRTRERTGILLFLALWERRAVLLADEGIHRAVPEGVWDELVAELTAGLRAGRAKQALLDALARCGVLLETCGVERRVDDEDELADAPRIRER